MKIKLTNPVTIIPAQAGWFVATEYEGKLDKEAVVAWAVRWDKSKSAFAADPITCNTERNYAFDVVAGYVLCDPHGRIKTCTGNKFGEFQTFESEDDAINWCKRQHAKEEGFLKIVVDSNDPPDKPKG